MEWEFINSVTIQLAKIEFENLGCNKIKMKYDIYLDKKLNLSANNIFL